MGVVGDVHRIRQKVGRIRLNDRTSDDCKRVECATVLVQTETDRIVSRSREWNLLDTHLELLHSHWSSDLRNMYLEVRVELLNVDSCPHVAKLSSNLLRGWLRHDDVGQE